MFSTRSDFSEDEARAVVIGGGLHAGEELVEHGAHRSWCPESAHFIRRGGTVIVETTG